jgi:hypothetical protein
LRRTYTFVVATTASRIGGSDTRQSFEDLSEQQILALAILLEEEDARIHGDFAEGLEENFPATAAILREKLSEGEVHRRRLLSAPQMD